MATVIEEFVATLGWEVETKELNKFNQQMKSIGKTVKWFGGLVSAATGAISALTVVTNQQTAVQTNLAKSVGISAENLEALSGAIANIGFDSEKVIDLVEELNNKIGEKKGLGQFTAVEESLQILGMQFKDIKDLAPEEQFIKILDTAKELKDQQEAVSAVDMLMGGDANKILGWLRTQDESLQQIIERRKALNVLNEEGRKGAVKFTETWNLFKDVIGSVLAQFSGLVGEAVSPMIDEMIQWVATNKDLLQQNIKEWVETFLRVLKLLLKTAEDIWDILEDIVDSLGGFESALKLVTAATIAFIAVKFVSAITAITTAVKAATLWQTLWNVAIALWPALIIAALALVLLIAEDVYKFFTDPEAITVTGLIVDALKGMYDEAILIVEEYIGKAIEQWADWLGVTKEDIDQALLALEEWVPEAIATVEAFFIWIGESFAQLVLDVGAFLESIVNLFLSIPDRIIAAWNIISEATKEIFMSAAESITNFVNGIWESVKGVATFLLELPAKIISAFSGIGTKVKGFLSGIPLIGSIFSEDEAPIVTDNVAAIPPGAGLAPSANVVNNANRSTKSSSTNVENNFNVTQLPGESGQDFSNRVVGIIEESAATAARNNESGIEY